MEQYLEMMTFKKFRIMKQEYDAVELLSSFHVPPPPVIETIFKFYLVQD